MQPVEEEQSCEALVTPLRERKVRRCNRKPAPHFLGGKFRCGYCAMRFKKNGRK